MNVNQHVFVLEVAPLEVEAFCPDCLAPWEFCSCELPSYEAVQERFYHQEDAA